MTLSRFGGWRELAQVYGYTGPLLGPRLLLPNLTLRGWCGYNNAAWAYADEAGLGLRMLPFFRFGHATLLVPWSDITARVHRVAGLFEVVSLRLIAAPGVELRLPARSARWLAEATGQRWFEEDDEP